MKISSQFHKNFLLINIILLGTIVSLSASELGEIIHADDLPPPSSLKSTQCPSLSFLELNIECLNFNKQLAQELLESPFNELEKWAFNKKFCNPLRIIQRRFSSLSITCKTAYLLYGYKRPKPRKWNVYNNIRLPSSLNEYLLKDLKLTLSSQIAINPRYLRDVFKHVSTVTLWDESGLVNLYASKDNPPFTLLKTLKIHINSKSFDLECLSMFKNLKLLSLIGNGHHEKNTPSTKLASTWALFSAPLVRINIESLMLVKISFSGSGLSQLPCLKKLHLSQSDIFSEDEISLMKPLDMLIISSFTKNQIPSLKCLLSKVEEIKFLGLENNMHAFNLMNLNIKEIYVLYADDDFFATHGHNLPETLKKLNVEKSGRSANKSHFDAIIKLSKRYHLAISENFLTKKELKQLSGKPCLFNLI